MRRFVSKLAYKLNDFIAYKNALGIKYDTSRVYLLELDQYNLEHGNYALLTKELAEGWALWHAGKSESQDRSWIPPIREFGRYLRSIGESDAYVLDKEYVYYDLDWQKETTEGNRIQLIERHKLPTGYEEAYEEYNDEPIEIAGREYEIDVSRVFGSDTYKEVRTMLEAPDFPLKKEYIAMKKKFENLKETYDKKKPRKSFISRFH